ncbi:ribonuclease M5 [Carboxydocella sp. ULO1]|nr:ribonuclease M5 [Carboxydocella sp. ULO1]
MMKIKEIIVVEGRDDIAAVKAAVDAEVIATGGCRISKKVIERIRTAQARQGVIILTDPDAAGAAIRRRLAELVPGAKHAYLPRAAGTREGNIGVENASPEAIQAALAQVKTLVKERQETFTAEDLNLWGLAGTADAAWRREQVGDRLGIGYANAKQFLQRLNAYGISREDIEAAVQQIDEEENHENCHSGPDQGHS